MAVKFETGNITKATTDAIVNAANSGLQRGGGVCGAIFDSVDAVGGRDAYGQLTAACNAIGHCSPGNAVITPSFGLNTTHIIHAVGPIWSGNKNPVDRLDGGQSTHIKTLADTYRSIIRVCRENNLTSVTVPAISTGIYGFPEDLAAAIAVKVCMEESGDIAVTLIGFNSDNTLVLMNTPSPRAATLLSGLTFQAFLVNSSNTLKSLMELAEILALPSTIPHPIHGDLDIPGLYCPNVPAELAKINLISDTGRNAGLCVRERCINWRGHCLIGVAVSITSNCDTEKTFKQEISCSIEDVCRWRKENGPDACLLCPSLLHHQLNQTLEIHLQGD